MERNFYELIGVIRAATAEEITAACLRVGERYRPDFNRHDPAAATMFALIENAFEVLTNPERRAEYDRSLEVTDPRSDKAGSPVRILDAGHKLLISGVDAEDVRKTLNDYVSRGAKTIAALSRVGESWVAACTVPVKENPADRTSTLKLTELRNPSADTVYEDGSECTLTKFGFKIVVTGPTKSAVEAKVAEMIHLGTKLIGEIAVGEDGKWAATCDDGGQDNTGFRW